MNFFLCKVKAFAVTAGFFIVATIIGLQFFDSFWLGEMATSFRLFYFLPLVVYAVLFAFRQKWWLLGLVLIASVINILPLPPFFQKENVPAPGDALKVVQVNVEYCNRKFDMLLKWLAQVDPDVIAVEELSPEWDLALRKAFPNYSAYTVPRKNYYGIGLFTKMKLKDPTTFIPSGITPIEPALMGEISWKDIPLDIAASHVFAPHDPFSIYRRNIQMRQLADCLRSNLSPTILLGDLNTVPWSSELARFKRTANLKDARKGYGLMPTCTVKGLLGVPIDYCLVSPQIRVKNVTIGPAFGSDHLPLLFELEVETQNPNSKAKN